MLFALKDQRAIWDYTYLGDQDIENISEATINKPENIDAGIYKFIVGLKPKVGMKYVYVQIAVANSGVSFEILANEPLTA